MPSVSHHFVADRPIDAVFDVVTTARFWPAWHPATRGVEGDVDHPAQLGDQIIEHVTIAGVAGRRGRRRYAVPARPGLPRTGATGQCCHAGAVCGRDR